MMEVHCTIEGNIEDKKLKEKAGNDLVALQNKFVDEANSYIDRWNDEWDSKHPETINVMEPGSDAYIAYGEFWAEKCNELYKNINNQSTNSIVTGKIVSVNGELAVVGILKSDQSKFVFLGK